MSVETIDSMLTEIRQLRAHKGPYYDQWLTNYKRSMKHCRRIARVKGLSKNWYKGMKRSINRLEKERNDNP